MRPAPLSTSTGSRHGTLRRRLAQTSALAGMLAAGPALAQLAADALPTLPTPNPLVTTAGTTMTVTPVTSRTIINWSTYNIGTAATVEYVNPLGVPVVPTAVLNRVQGTGLRPTTISESQILGTLRSADNISVYLVNPAGILFGPDATVSVGSLIASTRDIDDAVFGDVLNNDFRFTGSATAPDPALLVLDGSQAVTGGSTDPARFVANNGIVAFIAARVATVGTITASNEVVMVAANDTTLALTPGSPLQVTIVEGSQISTPMLLRGALNGSSILVAAATRNSVTDGLLDIDATMTATSAFASDQGIVLAGGPTASLASNIDIGGDGEIAGNLAIRLGGVLTSDIGVAAVDAGRIDVRARNGVQEPAAVAGVVTRADLLADGAVTVRADLESIVLRDLGGQSASLVASRGDIFARNLTLGGGATAIQASGGAVTGGIVNATYRGAVGVAGITAAGPVTVSAGEIAATGAIASTAGSVTLTAAANLANAATGAVAIVSANAGGATSDLVINAASITGNPTTNRAGLSAGRDLTLTTTGAALLDTASATRNAVLSAADLNASSLSAGGTLNASAASGALLADSVSAGGLATLRAGTTLTVTGLTQSTGGGVDVQAPTVNLATATASGDLSVISTVGTLTLDTGTARNIATISAATDAVLGTIDASQITISAGEAITADRLTATLTSAVTDALTATARTLTVTRAEATNATARLTASSGAATVTNLVAGENAFLSAATTATLRGGGRVDGNLTVTGGEVRLGGATGTQEVGGTARYTASTGTIASDGGAGITIRADADPAAPVSAIILDANTGIDLTGIALVTGEPLGTDNTGDVDVRLAAASAPLTLGSVDARALLLTPSPAPGAVTLGATRLVNSLALSAPGAISLSSVAISGANQSLSVTGTGAATTVTATGLLSATNGVAILTPGAVSVQGVSGGAGAVSVESTGATVSAGALSGASVSARAFDTLSYASANATAGTATLTSVTSGIGTTGLTRATGAVTFDAPGVISVGDVTSTGATVVFQSTNAPAGGAITAGAVSASTDLSVSRDAGLTFGSATSINGAVSLSAPSGVVAVTGGVRAGTSVSVLATSMTLGSVTADTLGANTGTATLTATSGAIAVSGGTTAAGDVTLDAPGAIALGDVRSTAATVVFRSTLLPPTGAVGARDVRAATDLSVSRAAGVTFRDVRSDTGSVSLFAPGGVVAVTGATTAVTGVTVSADTVALAGVGASNGAISLEALTGALSAGALAATDLIRATASTDATLASAASANGSVELLTTSGGIAVAGAIASRNFVTVDAGTSAQLGSVTNTGVGASALRARGGSLTVTGPASVGGALDARASTAVGMNTVRATGLLTVTAGTNAALASATSDTATVQLTAGGTLSVTGATTAFTDVVTGSVGDQTLGTVTAITGRARLASSAGAITAASVSVATDLDADAFAALSLPDATVGTDAVLAGRDVVLGTIAAGTLTATARGGDLSLAAGDIRGAATLTATGAATIGVLTTLGDTSVAAGGATLLSDALSVGGDLVASGGTVTLGDASRTVEQVATGHVEVTSTSGAITGIAGLTLRSDRLGAGGRDLTLRSAGGIAFAPGTLLQGGPDRQSAVRLAAGPASAITLGTVEARTIASPAPATALTHDGPVSIARAATRDTLTIALTGGGNPALTIGATEVRAGDVAFSTTGTGTFSTIDALGGAIAVTAGADLRLDRADAGGAIALTSTGGDIEATALTGGGVVTLRADATDGVRGIVRTGSVVGAGGIDIAGRTITAESLAASAGAVTASTRRDAAANTDQAISIGTIDASGAITLATGNRTAPSIAPIALDRATSTGGPITITTIGGGLAARTGSPRTNLSATGALSLDVDGAAVLGPASGSATTISATSLDVTTATATAGALSLTTRGGALVLGTGSAADAVTVDAAGPITATTITGASVAVTGTADATLGTVRTASGDLGVTVAGGLDAATLDSARAINVDAGSARITDANARGGGLTATARTGTLRIDTERASTDAALTAPTLSVGTLTAGSLGAAAGTGGFDVGTATIGGLAAIDSAGDVTIGTLDAGTGTIAATGALTARTLDVGARLSATGASATITTASVVGDAAFNATGTDLVIGEAAIGGAAALAAVRDVTVDRIDVGGTFALDAGGVASLTTATAGGDSRVTAGEIEVGSFATPQALTLIAGRIDAATLNVGALTVAAGTGGATLGQVAATRAATIGSGAGLSIARLTSDTAALTATGSLTADAIAARTGLTATARDAAITSASVTAGPAALTTTAGGLGVGTVAIAGNLDLSAGGALTVGQTDVGGVLTATGTSGALTTTRVTGSAAVTARGGALTLGTFGSGGALTLNAAGLVDATTLDVGGRLAATAAGLTLGTATVRGGDTTVAATVGDIRLGTASASGVVGLTSSGATAVTGAVTAGASYRIDAASIALGTTGATTRQAGGDVTLVARTGAITGQGSTTVAGTRTVALTARGSGGMITFAPDTTITSSAADVALATTGAAALGSVTASAGAIRLEASDAMLTRPVSAQNVTLTNVATVGITRVGDAATGNETEFGASATRFDLSNAEIGLVSAPTVTIASGARDVTVGAVGLAAATGSTRFAITAAGRVDMLGRFVAAGSTASRTIAVGSETANGRTGVIRIAATQAAGGRLLVDGAVLDLTADRIGAGLDRDFLDAIGYRSAGLGVEQVIRDYVARPTSTLYQPSTLGAPPYTDGVLVRSGVLRLTYGSYALFQNTGQLGEQTGVVIGTAGAAATPGGALRLSTPNSSANAFSLFGTIDGIGNQATALLGPDRLSIDTAVSPVASRINGCVIGSGGGCLNTSIAQPSLNLFDTSRAEIVRTADDLTLPFDPLIGTNNEALYLDSETVADATAAECEGDKPCPTQP